MKKNILRIILVFLILFWMINVFSFSNTNAQNSSDLSMKITEILVKEKEYREIANSIIRKLAHLTEYAIGGTLVYSLFLTYKLNPKVQFISSFLFVHIYAITDEIHQLFVPGRARKSNRCFNRYFRLELRNLWRFANYQNI